MDSQKPSPKNKVRLQKHLADCGVASRRAAEDLIADGRVRVDGTVVSTPGYKLNPADHHVTVDGSSVSVEPRVLYLFNKPPRVMCTSSDPEGRPTFLDFMPPDAPRLYTVGRLDFMSEGLLIVTNEGQLAHRLMHPRYHLEKEYRVELDAPLAPAMRERAVSGVRDDDEVLRADRVKPDPNNPCITYWTLTQGRNRQIRRMVAQLGLSIRSLRRLRIGPLRLGRLQPGTWRELTEEEAAQLHAAARETSAET